MGLADSKLAPQQNYIRDPVVISFNYGSINGGNNYASEVDAPTHEALIVGTSLGGRISAVRRFFCLLTTFDFLFSILVWFIAAMQVNTSIKQAFINEVVDYHIDKSLFDVVMTSALRFTMIIIAYALFRLAHWWVVALTTAFTGAFIIAKVFFFDWQHSSQYITILLLICTFVISWGEAWFLDFRVVPYEDKASLLLARQINEQISNIPPTLDNNPPSDDELEFYSPQQSDEDSEPENDKPRDRVILNSADIRYKQIAETSLESALTIIGSDNWRTEKVSGTDIIQSKVFPEYGKIFKFVGTMAIAPSLLLDELYNRNADSTKWNPTVKALKTIHRIDEFADLVYAVAAEGGGGMVKSRDFINARTWQKRGETYIMSMISVTHALHPPVKQCIRGETGPSAYILMPVPGDPTKCQMQWLLNTNLKGWVPQYLIDQFVPNVMLEYIGALRKYTSSDDSVT